MVLNGEKRYSFTAVSCLKRCRKRRLESSTWVYSQIEKNIHHEQLKRQLEDKPAMTEDEDEIEVQLAKPYDSIQEKFQVNIRDLRSLKRDRSAIAYTRRKSDVEQRALIEKARRINMSSDFKHK
ncbi:unnamed protein product, partial [Adineta steineri]